MAGGRGAVPLSGVRTRINKIDLTHLGERLTKVHLVQITAEAALDIKNQTQRRGEFPRDPKDYITIVDRKPAKGREYSVRPGGKITYWNQHSTIEEILNWVGNALLLESPYATKPASAMRSKQEWRKRHYADNHIFMVDGVGRRMTAGEGGARIFSVERNAQWIKHSKNSKFTFVNPMIYARRIEHGGTTTGGNYHVPWSSFAPRGVYKAVANAAKRRFGEAVWIDYKRIQLKGGDQIYAGTKHQFSQLYPAIIIRQKNWTKRGGA